MAKKKTIDLRSVDPTPVPAGDVNIIYNGTRIGGFSEDTEAVLKTAGCRVPGDIYVNYEKPETPSGLNTTSLSIVNNTDNDIDIDSINNLVSTLNNTGLFIPPNSITISANTTLSLSIIPFLSRGVYRYSIVLNNTGLTITGDFILSAIEAGTYNYESETYPTELSFIIS